MKAVRIWQYSAVQKFAHLAKWLLKKWSKNLPGITINIFSIFTTLYMKFLKNIIKFQLIIELQYQILALHFYVQIVFTLKRKTFLKSTSIK